MVGMASLQMDINHFYSNSALDHEHECLRKWLAFAMPLGVVPKITKKDVQTIMTSFKNENKTFSYSDPKQLLQEITITLNKAMNEAFKEKPIVQKRFEEALQLCEDMKTLKNRGSGFNGHDPIALASLMMLRKSSFEYFWVDVFCTPQRKEDIQETLKVSVLESFSTKFTLDLFVEVNEANWKIWRAQKYMHSSKHLGVGTFQKFPRKKNNFQFK